MFWLTWPPCNHHKQGVFAVLFYKSVDDSVTGAIVSGLAKEGHLRKGSRRRRF